MATLTTSETIEVEKENSNTIKLNLKSGVPMYAELILAGENSNAINPTGLGDANKVKVTYGAAQGVITDPVSLTADGDMTFTIIDTFWISFYFQFGRSTSTGTANIVLRSVGDGIPIGTVLSEKVTNPNDTKAIELHIPFTPPYVPFVLHGEIMRDINGTNDGGLVPYLPIETTGGWSARAAPSASIFIYRIKTPV